MPRRVRGYGFYKSKTYADAGHLAIANGIKLSIATNVAAQIYSGAALDGSISTGTGILDFTQAASVTTTSSAGSYNIALPIVVTGTDFTDQPISENLFLAAVNGNETIVGKLGFKTITQYNVPPMADGNGHFQFGVSGVVLDKPKTNAGAGQVRVQAAGTLNVIYADGSADSIPLLAGEAQPIEAITILASSTGYPITIFL